MTKKKHYPYCFEIVSGSGAILSKRQSMGLAGGGATRLSLSSGALPLSASAPAAFSSSSPSLMTTASMDDSKLKFNQGEGINGGGGGLGGSDRVYLSAETQESRRDWLKKIKLSIDALIAEEKQREKEEGGASGVSPRQPRSPLSPRSSSRCMLYNTPQQPHNTTQHHTTQHNTTQHRTTQHNTNTTHI